MFAPPKPALGAPAPVRVSYERYRLNYLVLNDSDRARQIRESAVKVEPLDLSQALPSNLDRVAPERREAPPANNYAKRSIYMSGSGTDTSKVSSLKRGRSPEKPTLNEKELKVDILYLAKVYSPGSSTLAACSGQGFSDSMLRDFLLASLGNRRRKVKTLSRVLTFVCDFVQFARSFSPQLPVFGGGSVISIQRWLVSLAQRGHTAPSHGRHALIVISEVFGSGLPVNHPAVISAAKQDARRVTKHAPFDP